MAINENAEKLMQEMSKVFNIDESELSADKRLKEDLVASSSQKFMILALLEDITGEEITYAKVNKCKTIGALFDYLAELESN